MVAVLSRTFTLGRYTCVERLGQSPVGEVWRAKRFGLAGLDRQYLVYRIGASQIAQDSTANLRLQAALRSVSEIQHQNLLHIEEFGSQSVDQFVAYEFVGFADLGKLKSGVDLLGDEAKSLLPQIVALIGQQLARALLAAQERGVMHGMLSPSCIWISPGGDAHIAELGLWAVLPQGPWKLDGALKSLGPYVAPELLEVDVRALLVLAAAFEHVDLCKWHSGSPEVRRIGGTRCPAPAAAAARGPRDPARTR